MKRNRRQPKVTIICPFFHYHPITPSAFIAQRHQNWELLLIHDGPCPQQHVDLLQGVVKDQRVNFIITEKYPGKWGHEIRRDYLEKIGKDEIAAETDFVVITNGDNYHGPAFLDQLLGGFVGDGIACTYHEKLIHNYLGWEVLPHALKLGNIDIAQMMFRKEVACEIGWHDLTHSSDWTFIQKVMSWYGTGKMVKVGGCHTFHN